MKKKYSYKGLVKRAFSYINEAVHKGYKLNRISADIRQIVNSYEGLNRDERYELYYEVYNLARASKSSTNPEKTISLRKNFDKILGAARRVKASAELRRKKIVTRASLNSNTIFYLCSTHSNCAEDHVDYQGRIYCTTYWRQKVSGFMYYAVLSYIKNHNIQTVQRVMQEPVWLTTRKYCKHYFIPMNTEEVLHSSMKRLTELYGKTYDKVWDADAYYDLRSKVYSRLNKDTPCKEYAGKISHRA